MMITGSGHHDNVSPKTNEREKRAKTSQVPRFVRLATAEKVSHFMAENTTQQHGPGETRKAPSQSPWTLRIIRVVNALPKLILRSPLHGLMSKQILLLTYTGRKSGKRYTVPITYVEVGETLLLATDRPWWKNLRGGAQVQVWLRGKKREARTEVVTDEATIRELYRSMLSEHPAQGWFMDIKPGSDGWPNPDDLHRAVERGVAVIKVQV
jgi:deazaflavin-dependent oxidoreductase (nitroreductase family)